MIIKHRIPIGILAVVCSFAAMAQEFVPAPTAKHRLQSVVESDGDSTAYIYDANNRPVREEWWLADTVNGVLTRSLYDVSEMRYNDRGYVTYDEIGSFQYQEWDFDSNDRVIEEREYYRNDSKGNFSLIGRKVYDYHFDGSVVEHDYVTNRHLDSIEEHRLTSIHYRTYDKKGRVTSDLLLDGFKGDTVGAPRDSSLWIYEYCDEHDEPLKTILKSRKAGDENWKVMKRQEKEFARLPYNGWNDKLYYTRKYINEDSIYGDTYRYDNSLWVEGDTLYHAFKSTNVNDRRNESNHSLYETKSLLRKIDGKDINYLIWSRDVNSWPSIVIEKEEWLNWDDKWNLESHRTDFKSTRTESDGISAEMTNEMYEYDSLGRMSKMTWIKKTTKTGEKEKIETIVIVKEYEYLDDTFQVCHFKETGNYTGDPADTVVRDDYSVTFDTSIPFDDVNLHWYEMPDTYLYLQFAPLTWTDNVDETTLIFHYE